MMRLSRRLGIGRLAALLLGVTLLALPPTAADGVVRHASGDRSPLGHPAARVRPAAIPNPSSNEAPIPPGGTGCTNYGLDFLLASPDDSAARVVGALAAIDNSRANEHLAPLSFDINTFEAMPATEQIFSITNLERTSRGLRAAEFMTAQLDRASQSGANSSSDPTFPASLTGGAVPVSTSSNWQGGDSNVLWADDTWMYDDGFGSSNGDWTESELQRPLGTPTGHAHSEPPTGVLPRDGSRLQGPLLCRHGRRRVWANTDGRRAGLADRRARPRRQRTVRNLHAGIGRPGLVRGRPTRAGWR